MRKRLFTKYTFVVLLVLILAQVGVSVAYSNFGGTIKELSEKAKEITLENQRIHVEVAKEESLTSVASRAGELGFAKPNVIYLTPQAPEALLQTSASNGKAN